jgi:hypothetical protein
MPTRKVRDYEKDPKYSQCLDPDHRPPTMVVWDPGEYEHTCPRCGNIIKFIVPVRECMNTKPGENVLGQKSAFHDLLRKGGKLA